MYDCVVLGIGGIGSAALLSAAREGWKVLGLDQFGGAHDKGSSHGRTRIIRTAYFEHPNYVPLARQSWDAWNELQSQSDVQLIQPTGLLQVGDPDGEVIQGVLKSAREHDIPIQEWSPQETMERYPAFKIPTGASCLYEEQAGFLKIENCVAQTIKLACAQGAEFRANAKVDGLKISQANEISIQLQNEQIETRRLIVCAGAWSSEFFQALPFDIEVVRKQQQWFQLDRVDIKYQNGFPGFLIDTENGCYYGFPEIDYLGMKVAEHSGGSPVADPTQLDRECNRDELLGTEAFIDSYLNFTRRRLVHHSVCMYSMSRDGHFIIDRHPDSDQVVFAAGMSGHGFKFAPIIGDRLVGLLKNETNEQMDFLRMQGRNLKGQ